MVLRFTAEVKLALSGLTLVGNSKINSHVFFEGDFKFLKLVKTPKVLIYHSLMGIRAVGYF